MALSIGRGKWWRWEALQHLVPQMRALHPYVMSFEYVTRNNGYSCHCAFNYQSCLRTHLTL